MKKWAPDASVDGLRRLRMPPRPRWRMAPVRATTPLPLRAWLTDPGSLTARIRARCQRFEVRLLRQCLAPVLDDEAALLAVRGGTRLWVREVLLIADGKPVVFGRSIVPRAHVRGAWRLFLGMGSQPLGAALFADPRIRRLPLTSSCLDRRDARYHRALNAVREAPGAVPSMSTAPARLWARRSVFLSQGQGLLVSELFLPAIFELPV